MQLFEAIVISLFGAIIAAAVDTVRIKHTKKTKVFGPWVYRFNGSGAITEIPADSVPSGVLEATMERLYTENKLPKPTASRRTTTVLYAAAMFIIDLIILMTLL
ncbi:MAG: hypothetical protein ACFFCP_11345 [Promethearchaeota archaeon]